MPAKLGRSVRVDIVSPLGVLTVAAPPSPEADSLHIVGSASKSLTYEANRAQVQIYNLNQLSRDRASSIVRRKEGLTVAERAALRSGLASSTAVGAAAIVAHVTVHAGYGAAIVPIFAGLAEPIEHVHQDSIDWVTKIDIGDGGLQMREATLNKSFGPGTPLHLVVQELVRAMGATVTPVDLATLSGALARNPSNTTFPFGFTVAGQVAPVLEELLSVLDIQWSIQDGYFVLYDNLRQLARPPVALAAGTGLIGEPEKLEGGLVRVRALLDGRLQPGAPVVLSSRVVAGAYRVNQVDFAFSSDEEGEHASVVLLEPPETSIL